MSKKQLLSANLRDRKVQNVTPPSGGKQAPLKAEQIVLWAVGGSVLRHFPGAPAWLPTHLPIHSCVT